VGEIHYITYITTELESQRIMHALLVTAYEQITSTEQFGKCL